VNVTNFSTCWGDGLALCALVHSAHPELIGDFDSLKPENRKENVTLALDSAEKFGIEKWMDTEDICAFTKTDPNSMMTYLSQFYNVYSGKNSNSGLGKIAEGDVNATVNLNINASELIEKQRKENEKRRREEMERAEKERKEKEDQRKDEGKEERERREKEERERKEKEERERIKKEEEIRKRK